MEDSRMKLQTSLPAVSFDYAGLVAWAQGMTSKYQGLVVTEDQVAEIRVCMSDLNKAKISVDNSRKETVKKLSAPLKEFEGQIKKVTAIFDATYRSLSEQVQHFVEQERENKRGVVQNAISEELDKRKGEVQPFAIPIQDKWLLKSTTLKSIREAVQGIIDQRIESLRLQQQAEQARAERASAIEQAVKAATGRLAVSAPPATTRAWPSICPLATPACLTPRQKPAPMTTTGYLPGTSPLQPLKSLKSMKPRQKNLRPVSPSMKKRQSSPRLPLAATISPLLEPPSNERLR